MPSDISMNGFVLRDLDSDNWTSASVLHGDTNMHASGKYSLSYKSFKYILCKSKVWVPVLSSGGKGSGDEASYVGILDSIVVYIKLGSTVVGMC